MTAVAESYGLEEPTTTGFRISIYWPRGHLCAQLTTESSGSRLDLDPGTGAIEFECPLLPLVPGLYRIDLSIESNGEEIDARQRCPTLRVDPGRIWDRDFYIENTWEIIEASPDFTQHSALSDQHSVSPKQGLREW